MKTNQPSRGSVARRISVIGSATLLAVLMLICGVMSVLFTILSQVVLSLQLPFAVFPLVSFTGDRTKMGAFVAPAWIRALAWVVAVIIAALNAWLLYQTFVG